MDVSDTIETEAEKGETAKKGWLSRLRSGLAKSTKRVTESITGLFTKKKLDQQTLDELEDALIQADLGVTVAARLVEKLGKERFGKEVTDEEVRAAFADDIAEILQPVATSLAIDPARKPHVVLVVGVNGSGKTTTIAKLANLYKGEGRKVMLAAGDTFRAAAVEQLKIWGDRQGYRRRRRGARLRGAGARQGRRLRRAADRHRGPPAQQIEPDGRTGQDRARHPQARSRRAAFLPAGARRHDRPERPRPGRDLQDPIAGRCAGGDQARRQRQGRRAGGAGREVQAAGGRRRCRRGHRRSSAVRGAGLCARIDGVASMSTSTSKRT